LTTLTPTLLLQEIKILVLIHNFLFQRGTSDRFVIGKIVVLQKGKSRQSKGILF